MASALPSSTVSAKLAGPAGTPTPGIVPNFYDPPSFHARAYVLLAVAWTLMTSALAMRLFTQWYLVKKYLVEDFMIVVGWAMTVAFDTITILCLMNGVGVHMWDQTLSVFIQGSKWITISGLVYAAPFILIRVAILLQILRVFVPHRRASPVAFLLCWTWIAATTVFNAAQVILSGVQCRPFEGVWNPFVPKHCMGKIIDLFLSASIFAVVADCVILILPIALLYKLKMKWKKKVWMGGVFATGALACVASIIRLVYCVRIIQNSDPSWHYVFFGICCWYQTALGIVVFCLPVTPKFVTFLRDRWRAKLSSGRQPRENGVVANQQLEELERTSWVFALFGGRPELSSRMSGSLGLSSVRRYLGPSTRLPPISDWRSSRVDDHSVITSKDDSGDSHRGRSASTLGTTAKSVN